MRHVFLLLLVVALSACSTAPVPVTSPYYQIPPGSKLLLKQAVTIPPNDGRVYIQYGKVVSPKEKDDYHAHCWFLSWKVLDRAQPIKPDTFTITYSQQLEEVVSRQPDHLYAMNGMLGMDYDGGPMALVYSTEMHIHSDRQPDIRRFICSHWEDPNDAQHLTVAEMQKAMGHIAQIQLKTGN